jgi:hypothetical protein
VDTYCQEPWTEAQWARVQEAVRDEARKQRVAASFLKWEGPLPTDLQTTKLLTLNVRRPAVGPRRLEVRDFTTRRLTSLSVNVALRGAQVAEPDLSSALVAFPGACRKRDGGCAIPRVTGGGTVQQRSCSPWSVAEPSAVGGCHLTCAFDPRAPRTSWAIRHDPWNPTLRPCAHANFSVARSPR